MVCIMASDSAQPAPNARTIDVVLDEFLDDQRARLSLKTFRQYQPVIELFQHSLNNYGYSSLDESETARFNSAYKASGDQHREFCQLFGPDKIAENVGEFLNYFMVRKVMCGAELKRAAGTVMKKLAKWLNERGCIDAEEARDMAHRGGDAARDLPAAQRLGEALLELSMPGDRCDSTLEGHFLVKRVEAGRLHLCALGPRHAVVLEVPGQIAAACRRGWRISGVMGRRGGKWYVVDVWNVYP